MSANEKQGTCAINPGNEKNSILNPKDEEPVTLFAHLFFRIIMSSIIQVSNVFFHSQYNIEVLDLQKQIHANIKLHSKVRGQRI